MIIPNKGINRIIRNAHRGKHFMVFGQIQSTSQFDNNDRYIYKYQPTPLLAIMKQISFKPTIKYSELDGE